MSETQEWSDRFYWSHGPCCAGCDWWDAHNPVVGDCTRSAPVSCQERGSLLGLSGYSGPPQAGHILTRREHVCGEFKDEFDWSILPLAYRKRVGAP